MATKREELRRRTFRGGSDAPLVEKEVEISEIAEDGEEEEEKEEEDDPMVLKGSRQTNTRTEETDVRFTHSTTNIVISSDLIIS